MYNWFTTKQPELNKASIENVCFKGGGMKGNAFLGVLKAFEEVGVCDQIKGYVGSSAGAIFSGLLACKISHANLSTELGSTDFTKFKDHTFGIAGETVSLFEDLGLYKGDYFEGWYGDILEKYTGNRDITFSEVYVKYGSDLVITTTDLTEQKLVYMCKETHPELPIVKAVRRSMSIPLFFTPVRDTDSDGIEHVYVDGGITNNYPIHFFDDRYPTQEIALTKTIGFDLESSTEFKPRTTNSLFSLVTNLVDIVLDTIEDIRCTDADKLRTIQIDIFDYQTTDFGITRKDIEKLATSGYRSTMEFFEKLT